MEIEKSTKTWQFIGNSRNSPGLDRVDFFMIFSRRFVVRFPAVRRASLSAEGAGFGEGSESVKALGRKTFEFLGGSNRILYY